VNSEHIQNGTLRNYLLRTLSKQDAEALEERYFTDSEFFKQLRTVEMDLICDYLDGQLNDQERMQFEVHYLRVPMLHELVAKVSARRAAVRNAPRRRMFRLVLVGGLACVCVFSITTLLLKNGKRPTAATESASIAKPLGITLLLRAGTSKGGGSVGQEFELPALQQEMSLIAELPGQMSATYYRAQVLNLDLDGNRKLIWSASGLLSKPGASGGQQIKMELSSSLLPAGDYILELTMDGGNFRETYVFRILPPEKTTLPNGR
jgi:hypothetical protein